MARSMVWIWVWVLVSGSCWSIAAVQAQPREELVDRVRTAIDRGVRYLKQQQLENGSWERGPSAMIQPGGTTSLVMLALLNSGIKPEEATIQRGLEYLRKVEPRSTYTVGLQTMVFAEAGFAKDLPLIQRNVDWLVRNRVFSNGRLRGWGYGNIGAGSDNSNTQYALLGLHAGKQAGANIDEEIWRQIRDFYVSTQTSEEGDSMGGWSYQPGGAKGSPHGGGNPTMTMTVAGLCGLYIAGLELNQGRQDLDPSTGVARNCGKYEENPSIAKALRWISSPRHWTLQSAGHTFYNLYGIERAGRLSGQRFFGEIDWYREGCEWLTAPGRQAEDGSWYTRSSVDAWPLVSTSFALLFLSKGRTPVLISKFAYNTRDIRNRQSEWNNKHHDAKNLVEYASKELFRKQPLAWQIYDVRAMQDLTPIRINQEVGTLVQSPIVYLNGHKAPAFTGGQREILRKYVEEGGFILAEACCGSKAFFEGIREELEQIFPDQPLTLLGPEHPIWSAHALVSPRDLGGTQLYGIDLGCKTVVVVSDGPLAGYWEERQFMPKLGEPARSRGEHAYRLAGNIIAYATGLELPKPRLSRTKIVDVVEEKAVPRGFLKAVQIRHDGDSKPARNALRNLLLQVRERALIDVALPRKDDKDLPLSHPDLAMYKFMYMHGRNAFTWDKEELENLRANLDTGGLLLADACCGRKDFDTAFRKFVQELYPERKLEPIPLDDLLFSEKLNGQAITEVRCRKSKSEYELQPPELYGIRVGEGADARWVVIYSPYDIGCALDKHKSSDCKGYDYESAVRLGMAALIYSLKK